MKWFAFVLPLVSIVISAGGVSTSAANTLLVPEQYDTIQAAVDAAGEYDEIVVSPGVYVENLDLTGKRVTLRSTAELPEFDPGDPTAFWEADFWDMVAATVIDGGGEDRVVTIEGGGSDVRIHGLSIRNGAATSGGAIRTTGRSFPRITHSIIEENVATGNGGAIIVGGGTITVRHNVIRNNAAEGNGGVVFTLRNGSFILRGNRIEGNQGRDGGVVMIGRDVRGIVMGNQIVGNQASRHGGVLHAPGGVGQRRFLVKENVIVGNTAAGRGGVVHAGDVDGAVLSNIMRENEAGSSGGVAYHTGSLVIAGNLMEENVTGGNGAAILVGSSGEPWDALGSPWPRENIPPAEDPANNVYHQNTPQPDVYFDH